MFWVALRPTLMLVANILCNLGVMILGLTLPLRHHVVPSHLLEMDAPLMVWRQQLCHLWLPSSLTSPSPLLRCAPSHNVGTHG
jgi:hypothetical protein